MLVRGSVRLNSICSDPFSDRVLLSNAPSTSSRATIDACIEFSHKKAQKAQKNNSVLFVPFCGEKILVSARDADFSLHQSFDFKRYAVSFGGANEASIDLEDSQLH